GVQLAAAALALLLLGSLRRVRFKAFRWQRTCWIDAAFIAILVGWAVIGPLTVDDGWATTIARNFVSTGTAGNYYRWWNADEVPFALCQHVLSLFTEISLAPLWLRLPSVLLGVATWFMLSRGVLGAALPGRSRTTRTRGVAALFLLAAWLPFNSGVRPEAYVALGVTATLAFVWRARTPAGLGWAALAVALTLPISPTAVAVVAPLVVFAPRILRVLRTGSRSGRDLAARIALLCCIGAVGVTAMFADQTWSAFLTATDWHTFFGPALPWYHEPDRYFYLLGGDQQGSAPKRIPVLLSAAMVPMAAVLAGRDRRSAVARSALRLAAVLLLALLALAVVPSKWSYHLGSAAGLFASFLTVAVILVQKHAGATVASRITVLTTALGVGVLAGAAALAFDGPNAWWQSTVYDVAWSAGPIRPAGLPLNNPLLWVGVAVGCGALGAALLAHGARQAFRLSPAVVAVTAAGTAVVVLVGSFVAAPLRRPAGSLALSNLDRLTSSRVCGLADDIEVLPDGPVLTENDGGEGRSVGFRRLAGYHPGAPPQEPPGMGSSSRLWGSFGFPDNATITTPWFALPTLAANAGVAVSVSGRTDEGNSLVFEFGRSGDEPAVIGQAVPGDRVAVDEDPSHPLWRSIGVDAAQVPRGADRIRISAVDRRTDENGWLAFTGPRLRSVLGLTQFLEENGPVLISWPQSFLFPCVHNTVAVSGGVAQTPRTIIESPRPFFIEDRNPLVGGTFAAVPTFGELHEVPTRLAGHPEVDWGTLMTSPAANVRDAYALTQMREVRWGFDDAGRVRLRR
ncbi:MAG: arabinosyltransferase, partial [Mycobacterium sp.]|nr:arabinosyltransferase [Mycobacterium sp.]